MPVLRSEFKRPNDAKFSIGVTDMVVDGLSDGQYSMISD